MQSQTDRLYSLLKDGRPYRTDAIAEKVYGGSHLGLSRVGARIFDCKRKYKCEIRGWKDSNVPTLYWYQITTNNMPEAIYDFEEVRRKLILEYACDSEFYELVDKLKQKNLTEDQKRNIVYAFNKKRGAL